MMMKEYQSQMIELVAVGMEVSLQSLDSFGTVDVELVQSGIVVGEIPCREFHCLVVSTMMVGW